MHPLSDNDPLRGQSGAPAVFHARGLGKTYHTGAVDVRALHDVDLDIVRGEFIVLLGASGSGRCGRSAALGRLLIAELATAHRALHPIPQRPLRGLWEVVNTCQGARVPGAACLKK